MGNTYRLDFSHPGVARLVIHHSDGKGANRQVYDHRCMKMLAEHLHWLAYHGHVRVD